MSGFDQSTSLCRLDGWWFLNMYKFAQFLGLPKIHRLNPPSPTTVFLLWSKCPSAITDLMPNRQWIPRCALGSTTKSAPSEWWGLKNGNSSKSHSFPSCEDIRKYWYLLKGKRSSGEGDGCVIHVWFGFTLTHLASKVLLWFFMAVSIHFSNNTFTLPVGGCQALPSLLYTFLLCDIVLQYIKWLLFDVSAR